MSAISKEDSERVNYQILLMQKCLVKHNNKKKNPKMNPEVNIIYDPCYKYSRRAKE